MAPIKFEDQIREKLEKRKLQPSDDAWTKLSAKLDSESESDKGTAWWWLGIAAGFIGILLVISIGKRSNSNINDPGLVDIEEVSPIEQEVKGVTNNSETDDRRDLDENHQEPNFIVTAPTLKSTIKSTPKSVADNSTSNANAETKTMESELTESKLDETQLSIEEEKVQAIAAQITALQQRSDTESFSEVDALLDAAQKELALTKLYDEVMKSVDANELLKDVEFDLDRSFRDKVFEAIKSNYKSIKTAVAQRNN